MAKPEKKLDKISGKKTRAGSTPAAGVTCGSEAVDDYLKAIFLLGGRAERQVQSKELATQLAITAASVTNMLQKLATQTPALVSYEKHHGVRLSRAGKRRALEIVRHHRLLETFLYEVLEYPWDEVHEEAERLEHFISERFEERIAAKLGNPEFDPHGHAIPGMDGSMPGHELNALTQLEAGRTAEVASVSDEDAEMLRYLAELGVRPGVKIAVTEQMPFRGAYRVRVGRRTEPVLLSESLAAAILVQVE